jgi:hypothetical protein
MWTILRCMGICMLLTSTVSGRVQGQDLGVAELERRIAELTPSMPVQRHLGGGLQLNGYDIDRLTVSEGGEKAVRLDENNGFDIVLYWQQLGMEQRRYQVLVQFSDIVYYARTGLPYVKGRDDARFRERLPVDVARGVLDTVGGEAGAVRKMTLGVRVPLSIVQAGGSELHLSVIEPDGNVVGPLFVDALKFEGGRQPEAEPAPVSELVVAPGNIIGNGSFETPPLVNKEGNWTFWCERGVMQFVDSQFAYHGRKSLRLEFFGGLDLHMYSKSEIVPVKPDTDYVLSWHVKSDGVTSASGPRIIVYDADRGWKYFRAAGDQVVGTTPWQRKELAFHTPTETVKLKVELHRYGSDDWKAVPAENSLISGTAWFDLIQLVEKR